MLKISVSLKPKVLDSKILLSILGTSGSNADTYNKMIRFPVIPKRRQEPVFSGSSYDTALAQAVKFGLPLYAGYKYWLRNGKWSYQACAFCTKDGKVEELNSSLLWKDYDSFIYTGIEVPEHMWPNKRFIHEFQNQHFIDKYSPLVMYDIDFKRGDPDADARATDSK